VPRQCSTATVLRATSRVESRFAPRCDEESQPATLSFARRMPEKNDAGNSLTYKIVVRNNGSKLVKLVEVDEAVPSEQLVRRRSAGETHDQTLHWTLHDLGRRRADDRDYAGSARPPQQPSLRNSRSLRNRSSGRGDPESDRSEEEHEKTASGEPPICAYGAGVNRAGYAADRRIVRIGFRATNLGPKSAGLKLNLDLPAQSTFQRGSSFKQSRRTGENESREDYLTAVAAGPGTVVIHGESSRRAERSWPPRRRVGSRGLWRRNKPRPNRDDRSFPLSIGRGFASAAPCNCGP